jgi:hypothetical protein
VVGGSTSSASAPITISAQGISHVSCTATDGHANSGARAGSTNTATVKLDTVAPSVVLAGVRGGATYQFGAAPAATCSTTDATSGVATASVRTVTGPANGLGTFTVRCSAATDHAGNVRAALVGTYRVVAATSGVVSPSSGSSWKRGKTVAVTLPLTGATRRALADATSARLAATRAVKAVLHARTATGRVSAAAFCAYLRSTHRLACSLRLPASLVAGAYWIDVQENLGWGFVTVPRAAGSRLPNPVRITVTR